MIFLVIGGYFLFVNLLSVIVCFWDKYKAIKGGWRISEQTLFMLCFFGGGIGMYSAMRIGRHKTRHKRFMIGIPLIIIMQVVFVILIYKYVL